MTVPAVTEGCLPQRAPSQVHAVVCGSQPLLLPQPGHTKPAGQRAANRYSTQAASSAKRCWNSIKERGKSLICVTRNHHVRVSFYHEHARDYNILWPRTQRDKPPKRIDVAQSMSGIFLTHLRSLETSQRRFL